MSARTSDDPLDLDAQQWVKFHIFLDDLTTSTSSIRRTTTFTTSLPLANWTRFLGMTIEEYNN